MSWSDIVNTWNTKGYPNQKDSKSVPNTFEHLRKPLTKEFLKCSESVPRFFGTSKATLNKKVPKVFLKNSVNDTKNVPKIMKTLCSKKSPKPIITKLEM